MSTRAEPLRILLEHRVPVEAETLVPSQTTSVRSPWDPDRFAREQLASLVRHIFLAGSPQPCRQVVLSAVDSDRGVGRLCLKIGRMLAYCSGKDVCLVNTEKLSPTSENFPRTPGGLATPGSVLARTLRDSSRQVVSGLWEIPAELFLGQHQGPIDGSLRDGMNRLRNEFEYSIVQAPDAGPIGIAESLAHLSDGLILVLHAH